MLLHLWEAERRTPTTIMVNHNPSEGECVAHTQVAGPVAVTSFFSATEGRSAFGEMTPSVVGA